MLLLSGAECFDPQPRGTSDILIGGGEILSIGASDENAETDALRAEVEHVDIRGKLVFPGLVDALTHPCGGGGEGGFGNRTPEIDAETFLQAGVTSPIGALGTDDIGRSLEVLYGNVMGLRAKGLRAFMYTGAYRVPSPTLTGEISRDVFLIDPVIGTGEVAVADHRGTQPSAHELRRLAAQTQLGGILAGAGGTVMVHVGAGPSRLALLREAIDGSDLAARVLYPTHVNRSLELLDEAASWARKGGFVDVTVSTTPELIAGGDITAADALRRLLDAGAPPERVTCSSDGGGSLPVYRNGELVGLTAASPTCLAALLGDLYKTSAELFPVALAAMTANPAHALNLPDVGRLLPGRRADLVVFDPATAQVDAVITAGRWRYRRSDTI